MRRKTLGLGLLLGATTLAVGAAAAAMLPFALDADTLEPAVDAWIAAPAASPAPDGRAVAGRAARTTADEGPFRPGYRRESRKRVPPRTGARTDAFKCFGTLIELRVKGSARVGHWVSVKPVNSQAIAIDFRNAERVRRADGLRKLPVQERLEKARAELGLTAGQMDLLRRATAERAEAGEHDDRARSAFEEGVRAALNDDQRRRWSEQGFGDAFGAAPGDARHVIVASAPVRADVVVVDTQAEGIWSVRPVDSASATRVRPTSPAPDGAERE